MRWIDFDNKRPTDAFPGWEPWSQDDWQAWLNKSAQLLAQVEALTQAADALRQAGDQDAAKERIKARNAFISDKSGHWARLKPWLLALSHGKCWFSESKDIYSHYHVEHFRPKSEAKDLDGSTQDGYWWLAFDYSNYRICGSVGNSKKGGWFPLREGSVRSCYAHQCEESESRYFLDPTDPVDVELIAFNEEGNAIVSPEVSDDWNAQRADVSIQRLKLNEHEALTEARRAKWQAVLREVDGYHRAKERCASGPNPTAQERLRNHAREIRKMASADAPLSSIVRWCLSFLDDRQLLRLAS
ncbi:HNH endonuclease family protein [Thiorhodovibrio litoralis]|uniref:hypothetical protein n=1 Tax=Thiorhodovibrio litoralis TaxID=2952932 RepID=UPI002B26436F|nr:hypothetical protein [Thiorhodovibrio litoralis]MBK5969836.1 hypothetical protein [Thiorhodovibrio winogradskyi]WPL12120.1 hypothetical protein Thiosp_01876 [Thiorhodovibrio litoralis]